MEYQSAFESILKWHKANRKSLPWRENPTPYHVWLSEIMLQQTRLEAVIPYYFRFLEKLPTVRALATVPDDELMKLWQGLGYYSRVRNLKKTAQILQKEYGGVLPKQVEKLKKLPGIGEYTAGAIASIAFHQPEPAVDGNVLRVMMRLTERSDDIADPKTKSEMTKELRQVYPSGENAKYLTEGLMELGEIVCIPNGEPKCAECPLQKTCLANLHKTTDKYPVKTQKAERKIVPKTVLLLHAKDGYVISKREDKGLLAGLYEFYSLDGNHPQKAVREILENDGFSIRSICPIGEAKHIFTHLEWHMTGYEVEIDKKEGLLYATPQQLKEQYALPNAFSFFLQYIQKK